MAYKFSEWWYNDAYTWAHDDIIIIAAQEDDDVNMCSWSITPKG